jgi:hypothetical protein
MLYTVEVRSLHTLRLESLKPVFQPLHTFLLTNYSFGKSVRTSTLCVTQVIFYTIVYRDYFTYNSLYYNSNSFADWEPYQAKHIEIENIEHKT